MKLKARVLDIYLLKQFIPIFFVALFLFVFILLLIDLFANLTRYLNNEVPISTMLKVSVFYIPKCISYAMPISLLFAAAYTLGDLYAKNELTSVFSTGIPIWRFSMGLLIVGLFVSLFTFFLDDIAVIPTLKTKNDLSRRALNEFVTEQNTSITIIARGGNLIYHIDYYDIDRLVLNGITIVERTDNGDYVSRINAPSAEWSNTHWEFRNALIYEYIDGILRVNPLEDSAKYDEPPDIFRRGSVKIEELSVKDAKLLVNDLRYLGLPYFKEQASYYHRFSFSSTSFIVMMLSISMSGRFRKNILLMSLFTSLAASVVYYVTEMLCMMLAGMNYIPPIIGAWFPVFLFINLGLYLLRSAKT
ncbi:MAG: LptF/LptG family permease [Treponema sp.]|jgi:lipopolysaccharide export system permease protein|nr:LptF/LptG family permease [Treponema sp.]